jgi:hypothetical protein
MLSLAPPRPPWWRTAQGLALGSSVAALTAVTTLAALAGQDSLAVPTTAARVARAAVVLAVPGLVLAGVAPRMSRRARVLAALVLGLMLGGAAVWRMEDGGLLLLPAAALMAVVGLPREAEPAFASVASPARSDLVVAAGLAAVGGVVGRAFSLDAAAPTGLDRLSAVAAGFTILAWPLVAVVFLPARLRHRGFVVAAAVLTATIIARAPAGGEVWLTPGVVLLLLASCVPAADDEVGVGRF